MKDFYLDNESDSDEDIDVKNDIYNYKGYFIENEEEEEKKFYEFGAHFPYKYLYHRLEIIAKEREEKQKELEQILKEKEIKETQNNENIKAKDNNLKGLLDIFEQKGKSRNRYNIGNGLTYMPQMNKKNQNNFNIIDNVEINLVKSTSGKNQNKNKNNKISKSNKNSSNNNYSTKYKDNKNLNINKKSDKKKGKKYQNNQIKIRKRNNYNMIYINNSLHSNINIFNKKKINNKFNQKNLTQDIFIYQIKDNLNGGFKSFQNSKEKLRKKLLKSGKNEGLNKNLNNFRNSNQFSYTKCFGYLNTKNISVAKNIFSKDKSAKKKNN